MTCQYEMSGNCAENGKKQASCSGSRDIPVLIGITRRTAHENQASCRAEHWNSASFYPCWFVHKDAYSKWR